jgi:hypothetical protein
MPNRADRSPLPAIPVLPLYMDSFDQLRRNLYWQLSPSRIQINNESIEGDKLSPRELQQRYITALSRMAGSPMTDTIKKQTPIFQRAAITEKQSIQDAANTLAALWKIIKA